jgi:hypothetical protein
MGQNGAIWSVSFGGNGFTFPNVGATIKTNETTKYHYVRKRKTIPPSLGNEGENPQNRAI